MLARIAAPFREFGVPAGTLYVIDRIFRTISPRLRLQYYELMVQPITGKPLLPARVGRWYEIREIKQGDPEIARMPVRAGVMEARFAQGAMCLGAFQKGEMIGYMWFCFRAYEEDEVRCTYNLAEAANSVFDFDIYIYPEHRLGMAFVALWSGANQLLRERGIEYTFSRLTRFNLASRRSHQHLGWRRVGRAFFLQIWTVEIMLAAIAPYLQASFSKRSKMRLTLRPDVLRDTSRSIP